MMDRGRDETWSDALIRLAPSAPPGLRQWAARRAAARGLGASALRAAPDDPVVLGRLGLHLSAVGTTTPGPAAEFARAASAAALGDPSAAIEWLSGPLGQRRADRRFLAAAVAPCDARLALAVLETGEAESRAACALALNALDLATALLVSAPPSQQTRYLAAALRARQAIGPAAPAGAWRDARAALNAAFLADGLAPPLDAESDRPHTLDAFGAPQPPRWVEGPLVSVVMAARNAATTLPLAAASMLAQTWRNLEVIVIDDGSSDATVAVAEAIAGRDPRLRLLRNARGRGAYGARNTGLASARGAFVALQDADDWAHPQRLERQMAVLARGKGLTLCRHIRLDTAGIPVCPRVFPFVRLSPITMTARAEAFAALGPFEEVATGADSEWVARFDERFGRGAAPRTPEVGLVALWASGSLSASAASGLLGVGARARTAYVEDWRRRHAAAWRLPLFARQDDTRYH